MAKDYFSEIAQSISKITGVQLGAKQRSMVESRINRRLRDLDIQDLRAYWDYFQSHQSEVSKLISLLTTHHTFFFREFVHFEFIEERLPALVKEMRQNGRKNVRIWCAACSGGHEVYSLAMLVDEQLSQLAPGMTFEIFGSDVDPESVAMAQNGVYRWAEVKKIPAHYISKYWLRGTGDIADYVKVKPRIAQRCSFKTINLLQIGPSLFQEKFDFVFCRNVFIYFKDEQVKSITRSLLEHVHESGQLFTGLSESLMGLNLDIYHYGRSIYGHSQPKSASASSTATPDTAAPTPVVNLSPSKPLRVLCVDDSPTVLTLLKKMLTPDNGFVIEGTAKNGEEAAEIMKQKEFDVMTLDIHMPKMNGIEYLETHYKSGHPPVVMVSSVSAENAPMAFRALQLGASDYVEKPEISQLSLCADQLSSKLKSAFRWKNQKASKGMEIRQQFSRSPIIRDSEKKLRLVIAPYRSHAAVLSILKELKSPQPPTIVIFEGPKDLASAIVEDSQKKGVTLEQLSGGEMIYPNHLYIGDSQLLPQLCNQHRDRTTVAMVIGEPSQALTKDILDWPKLKLIVEDLGMQTSEEHQKLRREAECMTPITSFSYESDELFCAEEKSAS